MIQPQYTYKATVVKVVDGDTVDLLVDVGFNVRVQIRTRLYGIDAPETREDAGKAARDALRVVLPQHAPVIVKTFKDPNDKYGRWLAQIWEGDISINQWLVESGYAKVYDGGART